MKNMQDLTELVREHGMDDDYDWTQHGEVKTRRSPCGRLLIFCYKAKATYENRWNWFERVSRGLIMDARTGELVARPFDKFWNFRERDFSGYSDHDVLCIEDKMDGSLGILYRIDGEHRIATKGSFESEQAQWATHWLRVRSMRDLPCNITLLFEIIYPGNRIVVDYDRRAELVLLAVRNMDDGSENSPGLVDYYANHYGFGRPERYRFESLAALVEQAKELPATREGWVVRFGDGNRCKIKGAEYIDIHRALSDLSPKRIAELTLDGKYDELRQRLPEEFRPEVDAIHEDILDRAQAIEERVDAAHFFGPKDTRKEFAIWGQEHHRDIFGCLMCRYSDAPYGHLVRKLVLASLC